MSKNLILILWFLLYSSGSIAQIYPCADFNTPHLGDWTPVNCYVNRVDTYCTNPLDKSRAVSIRDNHGSSTFENTRDYQELGRRFPGYCISFDYNITNDGLSGSTPIHPIVYLQDIKGRDIYFMSYASVTEGPDWVHVRAPISLSDPLTGRLPANSDGQWYAPGLSAEDFDFVMKNTLRMYFNIDIIGSSVTSEDIRFDNICISKCNDSLSPSCNSNFEFTLTASTIPGEAINNQGNITLLDFHSKSVYEYQWDALTKTTLLKDHIYKPGIHTVQVKETTEAGATCTSLLNICVSDAVRPKLAAGPGDTPCGTDFIVTLHSATNRTSNRNNRATVSIIEARPGSTYYCDWGDMFASALPDIHYYYPGTNLLCITETRSDRAKCRNCLDICTVDPEPRHTTSLRPVAVPEIGLSIVPNPAREQAILSFSLNEKEDIRIQILDVFGHCIWNPVSSSFTAGTHTVELDTRHFPSGVYTIVLHWRNAAAYQKLSVL